MINDLKIQGKWQIQLTMTINFFPSRYSKETRSMHAKSDKIDIMIGNETNETIE